MNQVLLDSFVYHGKTILLEWHNALSVDELPDVMWQQVYVVGNLGGQVPTVLYADAHASLPGGKPEAGESIEATTRRELREEINYTPNRLTLLFASYLAPGYSTEYMDVFLATDLFAAPLEADDDEFLSVESIPLAQALTLCQSGGIPDAKTLAALVLARPHLENRI